MKIRAEQCAAQLARRLPGVMLMSGDEPLQKQEALDLALRLAREQGFSERLRFELESGFDSAQLIHEWQAPSLFAPRRIFDLRLQHFKLDKTLTQWLAEAANTPSDNLLLISTPKLDVAQKKSAWVQAIEQHGLWLEVWPLKGGELLAWVERRLRAHGLSIEREALVLFAEHIEGNLLAAAQEIDKLALLFAQGSKLNSEMLLASTANASRHNVFELGEALLANDTSRMLRVLHGLQQEGEAPTLIAWALSREIRICANLAKRLEQGETPAHAQKALGLREAQMRLYLHKARRGSATWQALLLEAARLDRIIKGVASVDAPSVWAALTALSLQASQA